MSLSDCWVRDLMMDKGKWRRHVTGFWGMVVLLILHRGGKCGFQLRSPTYFDDFINSYGIAVCLFLILLWDRCLECMNGLEIIPCLLRCGSFHMHFHFIQVLSLYSV